MVVATVIVTMPTYGQRSKIFSGDQKLWQVKRSQKIILNQIEFFSDKVNDLRQDNEHLLSVPIDSVLPRESAEVASNDALIKAYQIKINDLEDRLSEFVVLAAGKDKTKWVDLRGKPEEIANAYVAIAYVQRKESDYSAELHGLVANEWHKDVTATVIGPGGFKREFFLEQSTGRTEFVLPCPGEYTTIFRFNNEVKSISKRVSPNIIYYDGKGKDYDYFTIMPSL